MASPTDGHTLLMAASPEMAIAPEVSKTSHTTRSAIFAPIMLVLTPVFTWRPWRAPHQLASGADRIRKIRPEGLAYGSIGIGSASHLTGALFGLRAGIPLTRTCRIGVVTDDDRPDRRPNSNLF